MIGAKPLPSVYRPVTPPYQHQKESLEQGWHREFFAYLLEMGLGKSRVVIDDFCINYELEQCNAMLVITLKSVYTNWTRVSDEMPGELQKWMWPDLSRAAVIHRYRAGKARADAQGRLAVLDTLAPGPRILVVNIEAISSTQEAMDFCEQFCRKHKVMIVVDESTTIKDRTSKRTKKLTKLGARCVFRRILTGSPITGSPTDLWGQFEFLEHGCLGYTNFVAFQSRYCLLRDMHIGSRTIRKEYGTQNLEELRDRMLKHSVRKRKSECLDLPPKVYEREEVELTDEQKTAYAEMKRTAMAIVSGHEVTTTIVMTQLMRLHQIVCGHIQADDGSLLHLQSRRADAVLDVIERSGEKKVVIWCAYRADVAIVHRALSEKYGKEKIAVWIGGDANREQDELEFQNGDKRFMIATQQAGAKGRTWTCARLVIYYTNYYDLELREQSEDRTHRIGQEGTVTYVDLVSPGTVEEPILNALRLKKNVARAIQQDGFSTWI